MAQKNNITYYDGVHVALSKKNQATLVTQDKELLKKIKTTSSIKEMLDRIEEMIKWMIYGDQISDKALSYIAVGR